MTKIRSRVKLLRFLEQRLQSGAKGLQSGAVQVSYAKSHLRNAFELCKTN